MENMNSSIMLPFIGAFFAASLALSTLWYDRRSVAHWSFAAGMAVLAIESLFVGFAADALFPERMVYWQTRGLIAMSFLPAIWLFFSLSYGRGNYREFLAKWKFILAAALLFPAGLAVAFHGQLLVSVGKVGLGEQWMVRLGTPGIILNLLFLL